MKTLNATRPTDRSALRAGGAAIVILLILAAPSARAGFVQPPQPWPGPQGDYLLINAEDFQQIGDGWTIVRDSGKRFDPPAVGGQSLSGAGKGDGVARTQVQIPRAGQYQLWIRFTQYPRPNPAERGPFRLTVEQAGKAALSMVVDESFEGTANPRRIVTPPYAWSAAKMMLDAGPAVLTLAKVGAAKVSTHVRNVDCLLLTTDLKYAADFLDWGPQTYARIRLEASEPAKVYFHGMFNHMREPFYGHATFDRTGMALRARAPAEGQWLSAGQGTPWMNLTRRLDSDMDTNLSLSAVTREGPGDVNNVARSAFVFDVASAPADDAVIRSFRRDGPGYGMKVRLGSRVSADAPPRCDLEIARETRALVDTLPAVIFGRRPTLFPMLTDLLATDLTHTPGVHALELEVMQYLGINGRSNAPLYEADVAAGLVWAQAHAAVWFQGPGGSVDPRRDVMARQIANKGAQFQADPLHHRYMQVKTMDEATPWPLERMAGNAVVQDAFRAWAQQQYATPADLGVTAWDQVRITARMDDGPPALYRASQQFRAAGIAEFFALATDMVHESFGPGARTTQNFSDGAVYMANLYAQGNDYFVWFKRQALDIAMSEDWTALGSTPQCCGWNVALLRAATRYHRQPISMYVISYGSMLDTKRRAYCDIAQGAKMLNFYAYAPAYQGHERGWSRKPATYRAIAELTREVGAAEHVLMDAMPPRAATAILYSVNSDIWTVRKDNGLGHERMHTYLALRHGQIAVDVLSEDDIIEGRLEGYRTAYLAGDHLDRRAVAPLAAWTHAGGTLVLAPGAASRDELNRPMDQLDRALSLQRGEVQTLQTMLIYGRGIAKVTQPKGMVTLRGSGAKAEMLLRRQTLSPGADAVVEAKFEDGQPAALRQPVGRGQVVAQGFLPALAYAWRAVRALDAPAPASGGADEAVDGENREGAEASMQQEAETLAANRDSIAPPGFDAVIRGYILQPVRQAGAPEPVSADQPLVEATLLEGDAGWVVTLANFQSQPLPTLNLTIRLGRAFAGPARSSRGGELHDVDADPKLVRVTLPLDSTDMVYGSWSKP